MSSHGSHTRSTSACCTMLVMPCIIISSHVIWISNTHPSSIGQLPNQRIDGSSINPADPRQPPTTANTSPFPHYAAAIRPMQAAAQRIVARVHGQHDSSYSHLSRESTIGCTHVVIPAYGGKGFAPRKLKSGVIACVQSCGAWGSV